MALRLTTEDDAEYQRLWAINENYKQACLFHNDKDGAKKARQANTRLYLEYERKQLPEVILDWTGIKVSPFERTLEERVARIELYLGLNKFN